MKPKPILIIDATGDQVIVTGRRDVVEKALDLSCHYHVEREGFVQARVFDPIPSRGAQAANIAIRVARFGKRMASKRRTWPWQRKPQLIEGGAIALSLLQK